MNQDVEKIQLNGAVSAKSFDSSEVAIMKNK